MLNDSPEIITISDSEEEVSFDLFNCTAEENGSIDAHLHPDLDDVFSPTDCDSENNEKNDNYTRAFTVSTVDSLGTDDTSRHRRADHNGGIQRSSAVTNSVPRNHIRAPTRKSGNSEHLVTKGWIAVSDDLECAKKNLEYNQCVRKVKSDPWTSRHMSKIAKKLEEREKCMKKLTRKDEKIFPVVPDNGPDFFEKKGKTMLVSGTNTRKKADRVKLQGVACAASKAYFDALELSPESKERRINEVSRVRVVAQRMPSTPENYWEVGFPSESEQRRRGLIKEVHVRNKKGRNLFH